MKKYLILAMFFVLAAVLISPVSASAKTKAGTKSGSFFYFFDKAFEKTNLFFTFSAEKKAKKALEYADERLAEAEESASENKPEAVAEAMENYQKNIEVLEKVLSKVPEEAKKAIEKAIEVSKERQEEAPEETEELEKEVSEIKQEVEETENEMKKEENEKEAEIKDDKKDEQSKEIEKLKKDIETLKQKQSEIEKVVEKESSTIFEKKESSSSQADKQTKQNENIVTLPNGAVVEMDESGKIISTIKEAPQPTYIAPVPTAQNQTQQTPDTNTTTQTTSSSASTPISSPKINLSMISNSAKAIPSTSNQILAKFTIYSQDDKVNSSKSIFKIIISNGIGKINDLSNFSFVNKDGSVVAGPVNPNNEGVLMFTDTVTFPKGIMEYTLRGTTGSNFSNEQWIYVNANTDNWVLKFMEESKPHLQPFQASEMGVFVSSQTNQEDNNGNYVVNINLISLTDLTSLFVKLVNKKTGIEYQQTPSRNVNNYSVVFTNIPSGNYDIKMITDATTLVGVVKIFTSGILVE